MKSSHLLFLMLLFPLALFSQVPVTASYDEAVKQYIGKYADIAVQEMMVYKIPASITLAQGIFESNAGRSLLATEANNHFGIKCHKEWTGPTFTADDETKNECFRKYDNAEASFRDHSYFLTSRDRYKALFSLPVTDYKGWAQGLKAAGYATNPVYPEKLIKTIEKYELFRFDQMITTPVLTTTDLVGKDVATPDEGKAFEVFAEGPGKRMVYLNNDLQFLLLGEKDNAAKIAAAFGVSKKRILKWNDLPANGELSKGEMVYLQPKKRKGNQEQHMVTTGETLYSISQLHGIKLKMLCKRNHLEPYQDVQPGQKLVLR